MRRRKGGVIYSCIVVVFLLQYFGVRGQLTIETEPTKFRVDNIIPTNIRDSNEFPLSISAHNAQGELDTSFNGFVRVTANIVESNQVEKIRDNFESFNFTSANMRGVGNSLDAFILSNATTCKFGSSGCLELTGTTSELPTNVLNGFFFEFIPAIQPKRFSLNARCEVGTDGCILFGPAVGTNIFMPVLMSLNPDIISILTCTTNCVFGTKSANMQLNKPFKFDLIFDWILKQATLVVDDVEIDTITFTVSSISRFYFTGSVSLSVTFVDDFVTVLNETTLSENFANSFPATLALQNGKFEGSIQLQSTELLAAINSNEPTLSNLTLFVSDIVNQGRGVSTTSFTLLPPCLFGVGPNNECLEQENNLGLIVGASVGAAVLILGLAALVVILLVRRRKPTNSGQQEMVLVVASSGSSDRVKQLQQGTNGVSHSKYRIPYNIASETIAYNDLKVDEPLKLLGKGGFGIVYYATHHNQPVAVKEINANSIQESELETFLKESELMKNLKKHPHIIQFIGICPDPFCIVTEFMQNGDLWTYLCGPAKITLLDCVKWIQDVSNGMEFLASQGIIHRDLAARNVLLDKNLVAKISDFGLSRLGNGSNVVYSKSDIGPLKWMSPEAVQKKKYSEKSDVWAFGILCAEVLTRDEPYPEYDAVQAATMVVTENLRVTFPNFIPSSVTSVINRCFEFSPDARPTFGQLKSSLYDLKI